MEKILTHEELDFYKYTASDFDEIAVRALEFEDANFPPELQEDEASIREACSAEGTIGIVILDRASNKLIGMRYGTPLDSFTTEDFEGHWHPENYPKFQGFKTLYSMSTAIHKNYRGRDLGLIMSYEFAKQARDLGYHYIIGHAHIGAMLNLTKLLEGEVIEKFPRWYGSKQTHYLYEMRLSLLPKLLYVPKVTQKKEWDCGNATLKNLNAVYGINGATPESSEKTGMSHVDMIKYLATIYTHLEYSYLSDFDWIRKHIEAGHTAIVNYFAHGDGHYSLVCGVSPKNIFIRDVADGKIKKYDHKQFIKKWYSPTYGKRFMAVAWQ